MSTPPKPTARPTNGRAAGPQTVNKSRTGGGFNPSVSLGFTKVTQQGGGTVGQQAGPGGAAAGGGKIPGSDFMSNEDIRAFCEHLRKESRNRATERAMDGDHLEAVLRAIPDLGGSLGGSRARARRVTRWLKKIAAAEKAIQKYSASLYATFEREYDSELRKIGKGRQQVKPAARFGWR
ncbi:plasmid transfer protein TraA [Streptomyces sp. NPDC005167]